MKTGHLSPTSGQAYTGTTFPLMRSFRKDPLLVLDTVTSRTFLLAERSDAKNCIIVMT